jgi:hypothetical protein
LDHKYDWETMVIKLREIGIENYICPICKNNQFSLEQSYVALFVNEEFGTLNLGKHIPSAAVICKKCGHIDLFALKLYGLLQKEEK